MGIGSLDSETIFPVEEMTIEWIDVELAEYQKIKDNGIIKLTPYDESRIIALKQKRAELAA